MSDDIVDLSGPLSMSLAAHIEATIREVSGATGMVGGFVCLVKWVADDGKVMWSLAHLPGQDTDVDMALVEASRVLVKDKFLEEWGMGRDRL